MAKKVLSIIIGTELTRVCEVSYRKKYKNKGIRIFRSISFPTPENTIEDGYIKDKAVFGEVLKNKLHQAKFKSDKVIFSIASSKIANREVILPPTKENRIMDIIHMGASDYFPVDIKDYILSYYILEKNVTEHKDVAADKNKIKLAKKLEKQEKKAFRKKNKTDFISENLELLDSQTLEYKKENNGQETKTDDKTHMKKHMRLAVYAVPSNLVKNYYNFASMMHFDIVAIDYIGNSSYQLLKRQIYRGTNVFIQLNEQDTIISILRDDVLMLQRTVGYGISALTDAVMEQEYFKVNSKEEAFLLLSERNLLQPENHWERKVIQIPASYEEAAISLENEKELSTAQLYTNEMEYEARKSIINSLYFLNSSIVRMLDYYRTNHKNTSINTIYLSGPGILVQGIDHYFASEIGSTFIKMDKLVTVSSKKSAADYRRNPSDFLACIGAVLNPINFVPTEFTIKKLNRNTVFATLLFALVCLIGSVGTVYVSMSDYKTENEKLIHIKKESDAMPKLQGVQKQYDTSVKELEDLQNLDQITQSKNADIKEILNELEKKLPSGTVIHSMQFTDKALTMNVTVHAGGTDSTAIIAKTLIQLKSIEYFAKVDVSGISTKGEDGNGKVTFSITCLYK